VRRFIPLAMALAIGLALFASPYASSAPDGLNRVAADQGFDGAAEKHSTSPIAGYAFPGIGDERLAKGLAGFVGTLAVFAAGYGIASARRP
jgi:PDGLE domain-containing protein